MGIIYNGNGKIETLYSAYGLKVKGKINTYKWTIFDNKCEKCYTYFEILDEEGNKIYSREMGNNAILERCFKKNIDNVLWYLSHDEAYINGFDKINYYDFDKLVIDVLVKNSALFSHRIEQKKQKERLKAEEIKNNKGNNSNCIILF